MFGTSTSTSTRSRPLMRREDLRYVSPLRAAQVIEPVSGAHWVLVLMLLVVVSTITWAAVAEVDVVTKASARIVPQGHEQVIASLEGGLLAELKVSEGQAVEVGQDLAVLDPTRLVAQAAEGQTRRMALRAAIARAQAEARGVALVFPPDVRAARSVVQGETESFQARRRVLNEALDVNRRNVELLQKELNVAESMSAKGLMSEVEVMRVRRQVNDLLQQSQERVSRFRQEASAEQVRLRNELALLDESQPVRDDALRRTVLKSPVRGVVKSIRMNTVGGVVAPGAPVMEVVPQDDTVLVELRIKPIDIGWVKVGQAALIKLTAYNHTQYGSLKGEVSVISPDALGDAERGTPDATWYRALVRADASGLRSGNKPLSVRPGMLGTAEIRIGERTVLTYLLSPMLRTREAFREK
jgi:membrane fusion protein, adhesin transport system